MKNTTHHHEPGIVSPDCLQCQVDAVLADEPETDEIPDTVPADWVDQVREQITDERAELAAAHNDSLKPEVTAGFIEPYLSGEIDLIEFVSMLGDYTIAFGDLGPCTCGGAVCGRPDPGV